MAPSFARNGCNSCSLFLVHAFEAGFIFHPDCLSDSGLAVTAAYIFFE
jgi:hypothetical protein